MAKWISVEDAMPPEHDSMMARYYGTKKWGPGMFRKVSYTVIVCVRYADYKDVMVTTTRTIDGKWKMPEGFGSGLGYISHWMPMPEPPKEMEANNAID